MLVVEIGIPQQVFAIDDAEKVGHASLGDEGVVHVDMRPHGGNDEVHVLDRYDLVIVVVDVGADFAYQSVLHRLQVVVLIKLVVAQCDQHLLEILGCPVPERMHAVHPPGTPCHQPRPKYHPSRPWGRCPLDIASYRETPSANQMRTVFS